MTEDSDRLADARSLSGVSETALMTLASRAHQAGLANPLIEDPTAIELLQSIDFDFDKFGHKGQEIALRALVVDRAALDYLRRHPEATVVALAEGFQTTFWRLNNALPNSRFRWVSLDFAPVIRLREQLLPQSDRITYLAQSALDHSWMTEIDTSKGVFITAEGLLMYLQPEEALGLIAACAQHFPGGQMFFDLPPTLVNTLAPKGVRSSRHYRVPPMPFSRSVKQLAKLAGSMPGVAAVHDLPMPPGRGFFFRTVFPALWDFGPTRSLRGTFALLDFV